jgi:hypothetical protein
MRFSRSECEQCMLAINSEKKIQEIQKRSLALDFSISFAGEEHLDFVYLVQDCPHDWLFPKCAAVVRLLLHSRTLIESIIYIISLNNPG